MPPRATYLPDALVGLAPAGLEPLEELAGDRPRVIRGFEAFPARGMHRIDDLAVDVELELVRRVVSDANGLRSLVALEPRQLELDQPPLARDAVEDLEVLRRSGDRAEQPLSPLARFVEIAGPEEGEQRQSRVTQPAEAVVPVAHAPDRFRQRRRGRCDDAPRRRVRQRLQRDERAPDGIGPAPLHRALAHPVGPVVERLTQGLLSVDGLRQRAVGGKPGEDERDAVALLDRERRIRAQIPALQVDGGPQRHCIRPGHSDEHAVDSSHPRHDRSVVETESELHPHLDRSPSSLDDPNDVGRLSARRHEVDQASGAGRGLEVGLEHERVAPIAPSGRGEVAFGLERPVPVLRRSEKRSEDRARVEARQAEPVDAAVPAHERDALEVTDDPVVLDARSHQLPSSRNDASTPNLFRAALSNVAR